MTEKRGRKSLSERTGEDTVQIKVLITRSQYEFVMAQPDGAASFIRYAIEAIREYRVREVVDPLLITPALKELQAEMEQLRRDMDGWINGTE